MTKFIVYTSILLSTFSMLSCGGDYKFVHLVGQPGQDGIAGTNGKDGAPGVGCEVTSSEDGCFTITCPTSDYTYCFAPDPLPTATPCPCPPGEVLICHKPSQSNQTKCIDSDAVSAHMSHGDYLGACL